MAFFIVTHPKGVSNCSKEMSRTVLLIGMVLIPRVEVCLKTSRLNLSSSSALHKTDRVTAVYYLFNIFKIAVHMTRMKVLVFMDMIMVTMVVMVMCIVFQYDIDPVTVYSFALIGRDLKGEFIVNIQFG